jgi:hypothetical protein
MPRLRKLQIGLLKPKPKQLIHNLFYPVFLVGVEPTRYCYFTLDPKSRAATNYAIGTFYLLSISIPSS